MTATDTTDNIVLSIQPTLTFTPPVATGAEISAEPSTVTNDGTSQATISVYLENGLGQPAAGKTVMLSENGGSATITPVLRRGGDGEQRGCDVHRDGLLAAVGVVYGH